MKTVGFRVRPVVRHIVTKWEDDPENGAGSCGCLGEFDHESYAEEVVDALRKAHRAKQYAIVGRSFEPVAMVYYADHQQQAEEYRRQLQEHFGCDFRVYEREVTDPIALGRLAAVGDRWEPLDLSNAPKGNPASSEKLPEVCKD